MMTQSDLDTEHLQHVVDMLKKGQLIPRRYGGTTALIELMVGEALFGEEENMYAVICPPYREHNKIVYNRFVDRLRQYGIATRASKNRSTVLINENRQRFMFIPIQDVPTQSRGIDWSRVFIEPSTQHVDRKMIDRMASDLEINPFYNLQHYFSPTTDIIGAI